MRVSIALVFCAAVFHLMVVGSVGAQPKTAAGRMPCYIPNTWGAGLDLKAFCKASRGPDATVVLRRPNAYGWRCRIKGQEHDIQVEKACRSHYGPYALAKVGSFEDPKSWYCLVSGHRNEWGFALDLRRHCALVHGEGTAAILLEDKGVYGWRCQVGGKKLFSISLERACKEEFGPFAHARLGERKEPRSWFCVNPILFNEQKSMVDNEQHEYHLLHLLDKKSETGILMREEQFTGYRVPLGGP